MNRKHLEQIAKENETPILVIDHKRIKRNYRNFKRMLPRVQVYFAVKSNPDSEIIKTLLSLGSSFDVASLEEFGLVMKHIQKFVPLDMLQDFVWNKIIYANPIKDRNSLEALNLYKPLLTYDSIEEMKKIKNYSPEAGVLARIKVDDRNSAVKFSNKFGIDETKSVGLIARTIDSGIRVEGLSFHVGSQCNNPEQYLNALISCRKIFDGCEKKGLVLGETMTRGHPIRLVDIGGGFPVKYHGNEQSFNKIALCINKEIEKLFPINEFDIIAEPGRYLVATAGTLVAGIITAKYNKRKIPAIHINDSIYHTFSGILADHQTPVFKTFSNRKKRKTDVFGRTCDGLDHLAGNNPYLPLIKHAYLPRLHENDYVYVENMGAYTNASATNFNGFPPAKIVHVNK